MNRRPIPNTWWLLIIVAGLGLWSNSRDSASAGATHGVESRQSQAVEPTSEAAYPAQATETLSPPPSSTVAAAVGYPGTEQNDLVRTQEAYPAGVFGAVSSDRSNAQPPENPAIDDNSDSSAQVPENEDAGLPHSSSLFLWMGFVAALIIFSAGVFGSIFLFTRQRTSGQ